MQRESATDERRATSRQRRGVDLTLPRADAGLREEVRLADCPAPSPSATRRNKASSGTRRTGSQDSSASGIRPGPSATDGTTGSTTTEAATTTEESTTTVEGSTPTAVQEIEVSDFEGSWEAASYELTSKSEPSATIDVIAAGAVLTAQTDRAGNLTGQVEVSEALGGTRTLEFAARFILVDQETMTVTFDPEIPPLLTDFTGPFDLDEATMTLQDNDAQFDFGDGAGEVPAIAEVVLVRV